MEQIGDLAMTGRDSMRSALSGSKSILHVPIMKSDNELSVGVKTTRQ